MLILLPGHQFNLVWLVWGQGHTKVKVIERSNCKCLTFYQQAGGGPSTERHSCWTLAVISSEAQSLGQRLIHQAPRYSHAVKCDCVFTSLDFKEWSVRLSMGAEHSNKSNPVTIQRSLFLLLIAYLNFYPNMCMMTSLVKINTFTFPMQI